MLAEIPVIDVHILYLKAHIVWDGSTLGCHILLRPLFTIIVVYAGQLFSIGHQISFSLACSPKSYSVAHSCHQRNSNKQF